MCSVIKEDFRKLGTFFWSSNQISQGEMCCVKHLLSCSMRKMKGQYELPSWNVLFRRAGKIPHHTSDETRMQQKIKLACV